MTKVGSEHSAPGFTFHGFKRPQGNSGETNGKQRQANEVFADRHPRSDCCPNAGGNQKPGDSSSWNRSRLPAGGERKGHSDDERKGERYKENKKKARPEYHGGAEEDLKNGRIGRANRHDHETGGEQHTIENEPGGPATEN